MPRLPDLDPADLTPEQQQVHDNITNGPRGGVRGPFNALMHHAGVAEHVQAMGINLRFDGVLPGRLRELAILTAARFWTTEYEWSSHAPIAEKEGLSLAVIDAIAENRTPDFPKDDEKTVHAFCRELHGEHHVSDATYDAAVAVLGHEGVVELTVLSGYYTIISMTLNTFQVPSPEGAAKLA